MRESGQSLERAAAVKIHGGPHGRPGASLAPGLIPWTWAKSERLWLFGFFGFSKMNPRGVLTNPSLGPGGSGSLLAKQDFTLEKPEKPKSQRTGTTRIPCPTGEKTGRGGHGRSSEHRDFHPRRVAEARRPGIGDGDATSNGPVAEPLKRLPR